VEITIFNMTVIEMVEVKVGKNFFNCDWNKCGFGSQLNYCTVVSGRKFFATFWVIFDEFMKN